MNPRYEKTVMLMAAYDRAAVGTRERVEAGQKLEKEASKMSERDVRGATAEYAAFMESKRRKSGRA